MNGYLKNEELSFLNRLKNEDLDLLVEILIKDKNGNLRLTETLTTKDKYKTYNPNHKQYTDLIINEIILYGSNTFLSMIGKEKNYKKIVIDVAKKMKINFNKNSSIDVIEMNILMGILIKSLEKVSIEDMKTILKELDIKTTNYTKQGMLIALQTAIKASGFQAYKLAVIVANAVAKQVLGKGLTLAANAGLTRSIAIFSGPIGWIITGLWTLIDIAGPAYRVIIPIVIHIAYLRIKAENIDELEETVV